MNRDEYLERVKEINPDIKVVSEFFGAVKPIKYICPQCKQEKEIKYACDLYRKKIYGCRKCFMVKINSSRSEKTKDEVIQIINKHENLSYISFYKSKGGRLTVRLNCNICNKSWEATENNIVKNTKRWVGCPDCWKKSDEIKEIAENSFRTAREKRNKITINKLREWLIKNEIELISAEEIKTYQTVSLRCKKCDHTWSTKVGHILRGNGECSSCKGTRYSTKIFKEKLIELQRKDITLIDEYNTTKKIMFACNECGHMWLAYGYTILKGCGCPKCKTSKGNKLISRILDSFNLNYEIEKIFEECKYKKSMPFDFFIPRYNICIEFDGIQHFKPTIFGKKKYVDNIKRAEEEFKLRKIRDRVKDEYCKNNNIKLIRIPYYKTEEEIREIILKEIKAVEAMKELGMTKPTFYRRVKEIEDSLKE